MYRHALVLVLVVLASLSGPTPAVAQQQQLVSCSGGPSTLFANCTGAPCTEVGGVYSCTCPVQAGDSASMGTCTQSPLQSRYAPIKAYQECNGPPATPATSWANCLGSPCRSSDGKTAICNCSIEPPQPDIIPLPTSSCNPSVCLQQKGTISSASPKGAAEMTAFLKSQHPDFMPPKVCPWPAVN
jgi:hypothetical protein